MFHLAVKILVRGQHSGVAGEAAACDTAIPYGYQFISLLLHLQFSFLVGNSQEDVGNL